jgi:hypothetical protein
VDTNILLVFGPAANGIMGVSFLFFIPSVRPREWAILDVVLISLTRRGSQERREAA